MFRHAKLFLLCVITSLALTACSGGAGITPQSSTFTFNATPASIFSGQYVTLTWNAPGSTSCTASGDWSGVGPASGSLQVQLNTAGDYTFMLTCNGSGTSVSGTTQVHVNAAGGLPVTISANPTAVAVGQSATITWAANGATTCSASGAWSGNLGASGSQVVTVSSAGSNLYYINCNNTSASGSAQVDVEGLVATVSLSANPTTVGAGQPTTLTWNSTQAQSCTASGEWSGTLASSGTQTVTPSTVGSHTYNLSCGNPGAPASTSTTVTAVAPTISQFKVFPATVTAGDTVTLTWNASTTNTCTASDGWSGTRTVVDRQTLTVSNPGTTQYTLTCGSAAGSDAKTVSITAVAAPTLPPATAVQITPDHSGSINFSTTLSYPASSAWSVNFPGQVSYPLIAGGRVFVTVNNSGGGGTQLYALNESTGAVVWGPTSIPGTYPWSNATYSDGKIFVVQVDGTLLSYDAATGTAGWSVHLPGQYFFSAPPTAFGGLIFVGGAGSGGTVYAVDESNGTVLWTQSVENGDKSSPSVTSAGLYVTYPCQTYAFAPDSGTPLWRNQNGCEGGGGRTSPVRNNVLYGRYFSVSNSALNYFDATTGAALGTGSSNTIPAVTFTQLFVMNSGTLQAINLSTGQVAWSFAGDGHLVTAPIVINDRVIVGSSSTNGPIYAVDAATGTQLWSSTVGAPLAAQDEQNVSAPTSGLSAGEGFLIASAGTRLTAWKLTP